MWAILAATFIVKGGGQYSIDRLAEACQVNLWASVYSPDTIGVC